MTEKIRLDLNEDGKGRFKVVWQTGEGRMNPYHVDSDLLYEQAQKVRDALSSFVEFGMNLADAERAGEGDEINRIRPEACSSLKHLASEGVDLHRLMFIDVGSEQPSASAARDFLRDLKATRKPIRLTVNVSERIHIPWSLAFDGDPKGLPGDDLYLFTEACQGFWSVGYQAATLYHDVPPNVILNPRSNTEARCALLVDETTWNLAVRELSGTEQDELREFVSRSESHGTIRVHRLPSTRDFIRHWRSLGHDTDILYFYGHADHRALALGSSDILEMKTLFIECTREKARPTCLVFLNGCHTAIGDERGGFLEACSRLGYCGFIGAEAPVPDIFGMRFAHAFLAQLDTGKPVWAIIEQLRKQHWPLSLIYGVCCHPEFRLDASGTVTSSDENFSRGRLGTNRL